MTKAIDLNPLTGRRRRIRPEMQADWKIRLRALDSSPADWLMASGFLDPIQHEACQFFRRDYELSALPVLKRSALERTSGGGGDMATSVAAATQRLNGAVQAVASLGERHRVVAWGLFIDEDLQCGLRWWPLPKRNREAAKAATSLSKYYDAVRGVREE